MIIKLEATIEMSMFSDICVEENQFCVGVLHVGVGFRISLQNPLGALLLVLFFFLDLNLLVLIVQSAFETF